MDLVIWQRSNDAVLQCTMFLRIMFVLCSTALRHEQRIRSVLPKHPMGGVRNELPWSARP